jgi:hypothetical protein
MRQEILTGAIKPSHRKAGLELVKVNDDLLALQIKENRISFFEQASVTIAEIHRVADLYFKETDLISYRSYK